MSRMKIAWWNCSYKSATAKDLIVVKEVVGEFKQNDYDIICLGEIGDEQLALAIENLADGYEIYSRPATDGRHRFCAYFILYKPHLVINEPELIDKMKAGRIIKVGTHLVIQNAHGHHVNLIISHWRSRLHDRHDLIKEDAAVKLRDYVDVLLEAKVDTNVILMGDYNDEPHNGSIVEKLEATRDISLAPNKPYLLYNLSWFDLTRNANQSIYGTYYYHGGKNDKWHVFDQVLVSPSFITAKGGWYIVNHGVFFPEGVNLKYHLQDRHSKIDHMPISIEIKELGNE